MGSTAGTAPPEPRVRPERAPCDGGKSLDMAEGEKKVLEQHSGALAQLASRMSLALHHRGGSSDPFSKVKDLITDMISRLEAEAEADATKKAYYDKEMQKGLPG